MTAERAEGGASVDEVPGAAPRARAALIPFPYHDDRRGRLTVIEDGIDLPFTSRRIYYIAGVPRGESRGDHAHRYSHTVLVALVGRFKVDVDDAVSRFTFVLDDPTQGLLIPASTWLRAYDFDPGSLCLALSSHRYDEDDYWRDYDEFRRTMRARR